MLAFGILGRVGSRVPVIALLPHDIQAGDLSLLASELSTSLTATLTATFEDRLGVVGPTGVSSLEGPNDMAALQEVLGACLVLSGTISAVANDPTRVVVFTQVVRTSDRVHLWAVSDTVPAADAVARALPRIVVGVRETLGGC